MPGPTSGTLPPAVATVAKQVEQVRGLRFKEPVIPEPLSQQEIGKLINEGTEASSPKEMDEARGRTLITMGALPPGTDLHQAILDFGASEVIGFYDTQTHRLVFTGSQDPSPLERLTLAHELTHALDDQYFDLGRIDTLGRTCQDERAEALVSLVEGNAQEVSFIWAREFLTAQEQAELQQEAAAIPDPPSSIPPFVRESFDFPYPNGQAFVDSLLSSGGEEAVDDAFRHPPVSTEQILHPEKFPSDQPQTVVVPDLSAKLGEGWEQLDIEDVGEGWLRTYLSLQETLGQAARAAEGWDGGRYRAWSHGEQTAVVLDTVWDSEGDAGEFADAMRDFAAGGPDDVSVTGTKVRVLFASDAATLNQLRAAAASS